MGDEEEEEVQAGSELEEEDNNAVSVDYAQLEYMPSLLEMYPFNRKQSLLFKVSDGTEGSQRSLQESRTPALADDKEKEEWHQSPLQKTLQISPTQYGSVSSPSDRNESPFSRASESADARNALDPSPIPLSPLTHSPHGSPRSLNVQAEETNESRSVHGPSPYHHSSASPHMSFMSGLSGDDGISESTSPDTEDNKSQGRVQSPLGPQQQPRDRKETKTDALLRARSLLVTRPFTHQAGGARELRKLDGPRALIVKPCCTREAWFYKTVKGGIKDFAPKFHGIKRDEHGVASVLLEDLTQGYICPCVLDVKMGVCTAAPDRVPAKRERSIMKDTQTTTGSIGARICGLRAYQIMKGDYLMLDKHVGNKVTFNDFSHVVSKFFNNGDRIRRGLALRFLERLKPILKLMQEQGDHRVYASSILFIYEGWEPPDEDQGPSSSSIHSSAFASSLPSQERTMTPVPATDPVSGVKDEDKRSRGDRCDDNAKIDVCATDPVSGVKDEDKRSRGDRCDDNAKIDVCATDPVSGVKDEDKRSRGDRCDDNAKIDVCATDPVSGVKDEDKRSRGDRCDDNAKIDVKMIDFAHVFPIGTGYGARDESYCAGLSNLMRVFEGIGAGVPIDEITLVNHSDNESLHVHVVCGRDPCLSEVQYQSSFKVIESPTSLPVKKVSGLALEHADSSPSLLPSPKPKLPSPQAPLPPACVLSQSKSVSSQDMTKSMNPAVHTNPMSPTLTSTLTLPITPIAVKPPFRTTALVPPAFL